MKYADGTEQKYTILNADLVQGDVLATNDTYEVVYEPGKVFKLCKNSFGATFSIYNLFRKVDISDFENIFVDVVI